MADDLHTSFMPKTPVAGGSQIRSRGGGAGFLLFASIVTLAVSVLGLIATHTYASFVGRDIAEQKVSLDRARDALETSLLKTFERVDTRLRMADNVLKQHTTIPPIFETIERLTVQGVRYRDFNYIGGDNLLSVQMTGEALDFSLVALQAKAFGDDGRIVNPIFSNLNLESGGTVTFDVAFAIDPSLLLYSNNI